MSASKSEEADLQSAENIKEEIKQKLFSLNEQQKRDLNNSYLGNISNFNNRVFNNSFSRKIVTNYSTDQKIYNFIARGTIIKTTEYLQIPSFSLINRKFPESIRKFNIKNIDSFLKTEEIMRAMDDIDLYNKFLFIFFSYIPYFRYIVAKLLILLKKNNEANSATLTKKPNSATLTKIANMYGFLHRFDHGKVDHSFSMKRFVEYHRLDILLNKLFKNKTVTEISDAGLEFYVDLLKNVKTKGYPISIITENTYNKSSVRKAIITNYDILQYYVSKVYLNIPFDFFNKDNALKLYLEESNICTSEVYYYTYNNKINRFIYYIYVDKELDLKAKFVSNNIPINKKIYIRILFYCMKLLKNRIEYKFNRDKLIEIIIVFYYVFIACMPFDFGTAAIAEWSLFSLWNTYINIDKSIELKINQNIMIDVEALSLPFTDFYHNCLNKEIYEPIINETSDEHAHTHSNANEDPDLNKHAKYTPYLLFTLPPNGVNSNGKNKNRK
jgi:hypothetical protein